MDVTKLKVDYEANTTAWMTSEIFHLWLRKLSQKFAKCNRNVLIILDNCAAHSPIDLPNIKLQYLPANTTSQLQPLDAGIIRVLKVEYRHQLLSHIVSSYSNETDYPSVFKKITVLDAIIWIQHAWQNLSTNVITNCFRHCGLKILGDSVEKIDIAATQTVEVVDLTPVLQGMTLDEYATIDENMVTESNPDEAEEESILNCEEETTDAPVTFAKARDCTETLRKFAAEEDWEMLPLIEELKKRINVLCHKRKCIQTSLDSYFL